MIPAGELSRFCKYSIRLVTRKPVPITPVIAGSNRYAWRRAGTDSMNHAAHWAAGFEEDGLIYQESRWAVRREGTRAGGRRQVGISLSYDLVALKYPPKGKQRWSGKTLRSRGKTLHVAKRSLCFKVITSHPLLVSFHFRERLLPLSFGYRGRGFF